MRGEHIHRLGADALLDRETLTGAEAMDVLAAHGLGEGKAAA